MNLAVPVLGNNAEGDDQPRKSKQSHCHVDLKSKQLSVYSEADIDPTSLSVDLVYSLEAMFPPTYW